MAIMVAAAFLVGLLGQTRARVTITLTLMTLSALILCQYNGSTAGRPEVAAARIVSVVAGVLTAVAVCNLILPWYMSTWAIQVSDTARMGGQHMLLHVTLQYNSTGT